MSTTEISDPYNHAEKVDPAIKSPFLALPGELRNKIYRYILKVPLYKRLDLPHRPYPDREDLRVCVALLRVSQQIYHEASTLLYGETLFKYQHPHNPIGAPSPDFRLIRALQVSFSAFTPGPLARSVRTAMNFLSSQGCLFRTLILKCELCHWEACGEIVWDRRFGQHTDIGKSICSVSVEKEIVMQLKVEACSHAGRMNAWFESQAQEIASKRSWALEEFDNVSNFGGIEGCKFRISAS